MNFKRTLLLGTAAVLATVGVANAADIIVDAPVEYEAPAVVATEPALGVCDVAGIGYFSIPGVGTCLKIGGAVEARGGYAKIEDDKDGWAGIYARMDVDTYTDSDFAPIGSKLRISAESNYHNESAFGSRFGDDRTDVGVELAYITVGPAYAGFRSTLFNDSIGYGEAFRFNGYGAFENGNIGNNSIGAGVLVENLGGGFYAGGAVEQHERSKWLTSYDETGNPDLIARAGIAGQSWGGSDLSVAYADETNTWAVKSTTDVNIIDGTQGRLTAGYSADRDADSDSVLLGAGVKHAFTEQVAGFAGVGYVFESDLEDTRLANAGVVYSPVQGFDVAGEVAYTKSEGTDAYVGQLKFVKSW